MTEATPFIAQQDYSGIVRTRSNVRDPNLENNVKSTVMPLSVNAPTLLLDIPTSIGLEAGSEKEDKYKRWLEMATAFFDAYQCSSFSHKISIMQSGVFWPDSKISTEEHLRRC